MLVLTGKSAPNPDRYKPTSCPAWNYGLPVKNMLNLMWAINGVPRKHPTTKQMQYVWFGFGGFSTFTAASTWALNTEWIDRQAQIPINTAMKIMAYDCKQDVPCGRPRWELPCFRTDNKEPDWTLEKEMQPHILPLKAPDPAVHLFEDVPTLLGVDAYEVNDASVQEWYNEFVDLFPEMVTARHYVQSEPVSMIDLPPAATSTAAPAAPAPTSAPMEDGKKSGSHPPASRISVVSEVRLLCPQRVEPPRRRGRPRKGSQPILHPFEVAMEAKRQSGGPAKSAAPEAIPIATLDEMDVDQEGEGEEEEDEVEKEDDEGENEDADDEREKSHRLTTTIGGKKGARK